MAKRRHLALSVKNLKKARSYTKTLSTRPRASIKRGNHARRRGLPGAAPSVVQ